MLLYNYGIYLFGRNLVLFIAFKLFFAALLCLGLDVFVNLTVFIQEKNFICCTVTDSAHIPKFPWLEFSRVFFCFFLGWFKLVWLLSWLTLLLSFLFLRDLLLGLHGFRALLLSFKGVSGQLTTTWGKLEWISLMRIPTLGRSIDDGSFGRARSDLLLVTFPCRIASLFTLPCLSASASAPLFDLEDMKLLATLLLCMAC